MFVHSGEDCVPSKYRFDVTAFSIKPRVVGTVVRGSVDERLCAMVKTIVLYMLNVCR